jgi:hypothetical protein
MYRKYEINEQFFNEIDSEEKAYFLGLLFADGCNNETRTSVRLSLQDKDVEIINKLKILIYPNNDKPLGISKKENCNNLLYLDICNKNISKSLAEKGMIQNKTLKLIYPKIDPILNSHFIRGYLDGDGCISYFIMKEKHFKCQLRILGTLEFCNELQNIINTNCNTTGSIRKRGNIFELAYSSRNQLLKVCEYLYNDSNIFLLRKFNKFQEIKNYKDGRYK